MNIQSNQNTSQTFVCKTCEDEIDVVEKSNCQPGMCCECAYEHREQKQLSHCCNAPLYERSEADYCGETLACENCNSTRNEVDVDCEDVPAPVNYQMAAE